MKERKLSGPFHTICFRHFQVSPQLSSEFPHQVSNPGSRLAGLTILCKKPLELHPPYTGAQPLSSLLPQMLHTWVCREHFELME